jgi:hypothetical protein
MHSDMGHWYRLEGKRWIGGWMDIGVHDTNWRDNISPRNLLCYYSHFVFSLSYFLSVYKVARRHSFCQNNNKQKMKKVCFRAERDGVLMDGMMLEQYVLLVSPSRRPFNVAIEQ